MQPLSSPAINCPLLFRLYACLWCLKRGTSAGTVTAGLLSMNSEEEFYDAETGEAVDCVRLLLLVVLMVALSPQGWSQMTPVRSVLKMPWCLTAARRRLTAAPRRRMECGSAGRVMHTRTHACTSIHARPCLQIQYVHTCIHCVKLDFAFWWTHKS